MTHYTYKVAEYPNSEFVTFCFANLGRSSYDGSQYRYVNNSTGYDSGWRNTPPVSYNGYYSSNFNISLSTGYSYSVYTRLLYNGTWYYGEYDPVYFYFTPPARPPTNTVSMDVYTAGNNNITMRVLGTYGATAINWKVKDRSGYTVFNGDRSVSGTPYYETFYGLTAGTEYTISANGYNTNGYAGEKVSPTMTNPATPSISKSSVGNNNIVINVRPNGGFDQIEVEMWTIDASSRLAVRTQGWNGGYSFDVQFGGLVANASYLFRARASKSSSWANYYPAPSNWGGWLTVKNEVARPSNWKWTTAQNSNGHKISGAQFSMLASEWNSFTQRINQFREYKSTDSNPINQYPFTYVSRGNIFYFNYFNEANTAIGQVISTGVSNVARGSKVYASYFNALMNALNNIT